MWSINYWKTLILQTEKITPCQFASLLNGDWHFVKPVLITMVPIYEIVQNNLERAGTGNAAHIVKGGDGVSFFDSI